MCFLKRTAVLFVFLLSVNTVFSQIKLAGRVLEGDSPVEFASVVIKGSDQKIVAGAVTDNKGGFILNLKESGKYQINISFIGYKTTTTDILVKDGVNNISEPFRLAASSELLKGASVSASYNEKQTDIEKTRINTSASIAASRGSISELLKTSSMISADHNNNISIRGNSNILILIDGIPSTVGSLDGIPASSAASIEIITNPDAKYDSEGTGGIINIITKRENSEGFSLNSNINYGATGRVNGDIMLSLKSGHWTFGVNYSGKYHQERVNSELLRHFYASNNSIEQIILSSQRQINNSLIINAARRSTRGDLFTLNLKFLKPDILNNQVITNINSTLADISFVNRRNEFHHKRRVGEIIADYKRVIKKDISEISFRGSYSGTKGERPGNYYEDGVFVQRSEGGGHPANFTLQTDFSTKIPRIGLIESGLKFFHRGNTFRFDSYQYDSVTGEWVYNNFFSSDLTHSENIYAAYINYSKSLKSNISLKLGARAEYGTSYLNVIKESQEIRDNNLFISPFLLIKKSLSESSSVAFSVTGRVTRPNYPQINPFVNMIDKSVYETGNRNIKPETAYKADFAYNYTRNGYNISATLYYTTISGFITQISSLYQDDALMLTYINGDKSNRVGVDLNGRYRFSKVFTTSLSSNIFYGETKGFYNNFDLASSSIMWSGNIGLNISPSKKDDIQLQYFYSSPFTYPQFKSSHVHYMDVAYKRSLINNRIIASISISDIFNTRKWNINSDNTIYSLRNNSKNQSRVLWLGLSFNLNNMQISRQPKREDDSEAGGLIRLGY